MIVMEVKITTILTKMESELRKAMETKDEQIIRERLLVIQTLCSLVLDEKGMTKQASPILNELPMRKLEASPKVVDIEDSSSDSLFDF